MTFKLHRRTVLKGLGSVAVGLPVLECMLNDNGTAYAQSGGPLPRRYGIVFAGQPLGGDSYAKDATRINGVNMTRPGDYIVPPQSGSGYDITTPLVPLASMTDDFNIVSNMRIPYNENSTDGADVPAMGAFRDFHGGGAGPLLCGTRSIEASFTCRSLTSDQVIANLNSGHCPRCLSQTVHATAYVQGPISLRVMAVPAYSQRQYRFLP